MSDKNRELVIEGDRVAGVKDAPAPKPRHTAEPWTLSRPNYDLKDDPSQLTSFRLYGSKGTAWIADILGEHCRVPRDECVANAHLLAAAPDLLAACQRVLAELEDGITMGCEEDLREAVAKAEGRGE